MKTISARRRPAAGRHAKRPPVRRTHPARHHKKHAAAAKAGAAVLTPVIVETVTTEIEEVSPFYGVEPDKREEELSDEEILDREERQDLY